jgi:hypothetical protein
VAAANTTQLLADIRAGRIPSGSLIVVDEGSMVSMARLSALIGHAAQHGCKVVLAGDQEQLGAVEGGGAMMLLADRLGYVQLAEPVRFTAAWERDASLRLRRGDASALDDYDQHGRICGAPPDEAMDQAAKAYVASYLAGRDVLLAAADWARCRELSMRIRDDLIHLGLVDGTRTVWIAEGATAGVGDLIICRGSEDRHWLYPAMTRGTDTNLAFVFTTPAKPADPQLGTRPAPELQRYEWIRQEREDHPPSRPPSQLGGPDLREPIAVLADVLQRGGSELSASQTKARNLANADNLAILNAIWAAETRQAQDDRYRELVTAALPPAYRRELSHQAKWLFRTLRAAELASLDPAEVTRTAIESRDLAGARDIASVIDARIRQRVHPLLPQPQGPWSDHIPHLPNPQRHQYLTEVTAMMDDRKQRIGQFASTNTLSWAVSALGPVPADPNIRLDWEKKASSIGAYRETYGYDHPTDPIGPEPTHDSPGPARCLARGVPRPRPGRQTRRPRHTRRPPMAHP